MCWWPYPTEFPARADEPYRQTMTTISTDFANIFGTNTNDERDNVLFKRKLILRLLDDDSLRDRLLTASSRELALQKIEEIVNKLVSL